MQKEKQYHDFYQSFKECIIQTHLGKASDMQGVLETEIKATEQRYQITFPLAFRVALLHFGRKMAIGGSISYTMQFVLHELECIMNMAARLNLKAVMQRIGIVTVYHDNGSWTDLSLETVLALDKVVFIHYDYDADGYIFIDCSRENPLIFFLMEPAQLDGRELGEIVTNCDTFTTFIRNSLFWHLDYSLNPNLGRLLPHGANVAGATWFKEYKALGAIHQLRTSFCTKNQIQEQKGSRILTIDEFEWAFINYVKSL